MGSCHDFVVLGAHVRMLIGINGCHSNANFRMSINDVYFGKGDLFFYVYVKAAFVLTSTIQFNI